MPCKSETQIALHFALKINNIIYAKGAALGTPEYFEIREICASILRADAEEKFLEKVARASLSPFGNCPLCRNPARMRDAKLYCPRCKQELEKTE